ncbi:hypothetical protein NK553_19280 [Pseudomonas sp. ZM23]|uniref:Lipoprotein n=1 Tax=Pseudomonas triclosanedens TaxID=2961893 RepID=A0ABY6ZQU2_9PSED|nr:hypothetical protein [Pseudomonas triclosanedens]MCP8466099.1 hypothetical protein [Pseudomonas triclosanedens]MCP8472334.1 hypothetical protein [Pseudomonas triclosanedens]MCP8477398.1 hypothetical protein [Pseudomonas triclosanedens]WAI47267.1 hypothetical protein OU419_15935 [Pseudomonas triclosanedens]
MKKLTALLLLMTLAASVQASDFCTGIGLFARAGAMYRDQGKTEQQAISALHDGSAKLDTDTQVVVRYFVRFGYHGDQTPDQAFASAEEKCRQYEESSERRNAMN